MLGIIEKGCKIWFTLAVCLWALFLLFFAHMLSFDPNSSCYGLCKIVIFQINWSITLISQSWFRGSKGLAVTGCAKTFLFSGFDRDLNS